MKYKNAAILFGYYRLLVQTPRKYMFREAKFQ